MKTKVYVSLPITGYDLEETKKYANQVKKWLEEKGYEVITPLTLVVNRINPISITWERALRLFWSVMLFILFLIGRHQKAVWQSLR